LASARERARGRILVDVAVPSEARKAAPRCGKGARLVRSQAAPENPQAQAGGDLVLSNLDGTTSVGDNVTALTYRTHRRILLKEHSEFNEKWLQDRISEDPAITGLGELVLVERERRQERAGRLDLLMSEEEEY
jgi:hypothetical protein